MNGDDDDRLPEDMAQRLSSCFDRAIDMSKLSAITDKGHWSTTSKSRVLQYPDGTFDIITPLSVFDVSDAKFETVEIAVQNILDGPVCINALGGHAAWTMQVTFKGTDYIVKEGIPGTTYDEDYQDPSLWNDSLYESAVATYAATLLSGNTDLSPWNFRLTRDNRVVCIDHDYAKTHSIDDFGDGHDFVADSLWTDVLSRTLTLANELHTGERSQPDAISDRRKEIITENTTAYAKTE